MRMKKRQGERGTEKFDVMVLIRSLFFAFCFCFLSFLSKKKIVVEFKYFR